ncbi:MAG: Gfo/Idh/MocA family oxidoreductase [Thermoguttaceae bacterium]|nr:Gfo/Idh/MocA family oxidoreductase [Thermoguttaceae bacterium]MDW8079386.1 Gfo/Idh/MocA family oxidoreductase [Thermoguttaceae bacterium]
MKSKQPGNGSQAESGRLSRRRWLGGATTAALLAGSCHQGVPALASRKYRVAIIGHTGRGDYGHGLDVAWLDIPQAEIVGVADPDPQGLAEAVKRLGGPPGFADYRQMLQKTKPDFVSICPRWVDQHCQMVLAAVEAGVRGIFLEKPMCRTLAEADTIVATCEKNNVKLVQAFQTRYSPKLRWIDELIASGQLGEILEIRARGKEDRRGGAEDLFVLGVHMFNLMQYFGGEPLWCFGLVEKDGRPIRREDVQEGNEGLGPLAGDNVHAMYKLKKGPVGYFDSRKDAQGRPTRFGISIYGSKGIVQLFNTGQLPEVFFLPDSSWSPGRSKKQWIPISSNGLGKPETIDDPALHGGNVLAIQDLMAAVEEDRQPQANMYEARWSIEMVMAVFESQRLGKPVTFPLATRENPLELL